MKYEEALSFHRSKRLGQLLVDGRPDRPGILLDFFHKGPCGQVDADQCVRYGSSLDFRKLGIKPRVLIDFPRFAGVLMML